MHIKLSFKEGLDPNYISQLADVIMKKQWEVITSSPVIEPEATNPQKSQLPMIKTRTGIIGIERSLQEKQKATDQSITMAFQDLKKLMEMAKDMVSISKTISNKIRVIIVD